jgi:hypothetical protein
MPTIVLAVQACWALQRVLDRTASHLKRAVQVGAIGLLGATGYLFHAYADLLTPRSTGEFVVPTPHLPAVPSGTDWGVLPLAGVPYDPDSNYQSVSFTMVYVHAIQMGTLVTAAGIVLALALRRRGP